MHIESTAAIRIGVDLHGVIDNNVVLFKALSEILLLNKEVPIEIYVISGPPKEDVLIELDGLQLYKNINYTDIYTIVDFLKSKGVKMWLDHKNTWWASDEDWWGAKAKICDQLCIDVMIDNTDRYKQYFNNISTKFVIYKD